MLTKHFERQRPRLEDQIRWVKDPGFLEEMKTHLENLRAAKSGKGVSLKGPAKHPGKKSKRRVKKKKARVKTPEPQSMFKDKKQLSQARLLTGTRGVSRQQDVNTLYARRAYIALGGEKPPSPHSSRTCARRRRPHCRGCPARRYWCCCGDTPTARPG